MHNRLNWEQDSLARRAIRPLPMPTRDHGLGARLAAAVSAAVQSDILRNRPALDALCAAVRDRARELRAEGRRADEALMVLKREVTALLPNQQSDPFRAEQVVQLVVRWCVAEYYAAN
jgi:hypothetical protein